MVGQPFDAEPVPDHLVRVVGDGVLDLVLADLVADVLGVLLGLEFRRVDADHDELVLVLGFSSFARSGRTWWQLMQQ